MRSITLEEAQSHLAEIIDNLPPGGEVVIHPGGERPVAKLSRHDERGAPPAAGSRQRHADDHRGRRRPPRGLRRVHAVKLLLDTRNSVLWFYLDDPQLSAAANRGHHRPGE